MQGLRVSRGIGLLFSRIFSTRWGWGVSPKLRPPLPPGKKTVPIAQEAGWAPGLIWTDGKSRPNRNSIPDRQARSQSEHRMSYPAHWKSGQPLQKGFRSYLRKVGNITPKFISIFYPIPNSEISQPFEPTQHRYHSRLKKHSLNKLSMFISVFNQLDASGIITHIGVMIPEAV